MMQLSILLSLISSFYMCGVIWLIQMIHYPSFLLISPSSFIEFHHKHTTAMSILVGPVMVIEFISAILWVSLDRSVATYSNLGLVIALWILTFFVSVPLHNQLADQFDVSVIEKLILTNWPRTILWTAKAALVLFQVSKVYKS